MSRRRRGWEKSDKTPSALGTDEMAELRVRVDKLESTTLHATLDCVRTPMEVLESLVHPEAIAQLQRAYEYADGGDGSLRYLVRTGHPSTLVTFSNRCWDDLKIIPPTKPAAMKPLMGTHILDPVIDQAIKVQREFAVVRHVLNWLDEHATLGAFVYYFPAIRALAKHKAMPKGTIKQHRYPAGIGDLLPLIRDAATTLAGSLCLPKATAIKEARMTLVLSEHTFTRQERNVTAPLTYVEIAP